MKILAALHAVLSTLSSEGISKNRNNSQQNYKFRGIDDVYNAISGLFAANKILPLPRYVDVYQTERESGSGKAIFVTRLNGYFKLMSLEDGSEVEIGPFPGEAMDSADKSTNKAMSASFKYALLQTFIIPTEADNDADATTHDVKSRTQQKQDATPTREQERPAVLRGGAPTKEPQRESAAPAADVQQKADHPILGQLKQALSKYGDNRPKIEAALAEEFKVESINAIPAAILPQALLRVMNHQKEARAAAAAKKAEAGNKKPAAKKAPAKKAPLPPPDNDSGLDQQVDDGTDDDGDLPV